MAKRESDQLDLPLPLHTNILPSLVLRCSSYTILSLTLWNLLFLKPCRPSFLHPSSRKERDFSLFFTTMKTENKGM